MPTKKVRDWWTDLPPVVFGEPDRNEAAVGQGPAMPSGYTGAGPDGVVQQDRRTPGVGSPVTDKHEGEWVFSADETAAIGPDILRDMAGAVHGGRFDPNAMRAAIGQQPKMGLQSGTYSATQPPPDDQNNEGLPPAPKITGTPTAIQQANLPENVAGRQQAYDIGRGMEAIGMQPANYNITPGQAEGTDITGMKTVTPPPPKTVETPKPPTLEPPKAPAPDYRQMALERDAAIGRGDIPALEMSDEARGQAGIGVTPDTVTAAAPTTDQYDTDMEAAQDILRGLMSGDSAYIQSTLNRLVSAQSGADAAALAALKQQGLQGNISPQAMSAMMAAAVRDTSGQLSKLLGDIGGDILKLQIDSAQNLFENARTLQKYDDEAFGRMANDIANGMSLSRFLEEYGPDGATEADYMAISMSQSQKTPSDLIGLMLDAGSSSTDILGNESLRTQIAADYGVDPSDPIVDQAIGDMISSMRTQKSEEFGALADGRITALLDFDPGMSATDMLAEDPNLKAYVANMLKIDDPDSPTGAARIEAWVENRRDYLNRDGTQQTVIDLVDDGIINEQYFDNPDAAITDPSNARTFEALQTSIRSWRNSSSDINEDGTPNYATIAWPWNDPATAFDYTTPNGADITQYNTDGTPVYDREEVMTAPGNGTNFYVTNPDGTTRPVTQGDVVDKISQLNAQGVDLYDYFDNGVFDARKFLNERFGPSQIQVYSQSGVATSIAMNENGVADELVNLDTLLTNAPLEGEYWEALPSNEVTQVTDMPPGSFVWYDENNQAHMSTEASLINGIFTQFYQALRDTPLAGADGVLDIAEFQQIWDGGKGWQIDPATGMVSNLYGDDGRMRSDLSPENNYGLGDMPSQPTNLAYVTKGDYEVYKQRVPMSGTIQDWEVELQRNTDVYGKPSVVKNGAGNTTAFNVNMNATTKSAIEGSVNQPFFVNGVEYTINGVESDVVMATRNDVDFVFDVIVLENDAGEIFYYAPGFKYGFANTAGKAGDAFDDASASSLRAA